MISQVRSVAVCSRSFSRNESLRSLLKETIDEVKFNDAGLILARDELVDFLHGYDAAIIGLEVMSAEVINNLPDLRVISKYGVGLNNIDLHAVRSKNIFVGWTPGVNRRSVSELVVSQAISMLRGLPQAWSNLDQRKWGQVVGKELSSSTFGIVGFGNVGSDLAKLLRAFGGEIVAYDRSSLVMESLPEHVQKADLSSVLSSSDIISLHVPLDDSTIDLISYEELAQMKAQSYLINTSRGGVVNEKALSHAVSTGLIAGAFLDVLYTEPPDSLSWELIDQPNIIVTPHLGGSSREAIWNMGINAIRGLGDAKLL